MASYSGTLTSSQGVRTLDVTPNDVITFTPTSGSYTVEYPIGTVAINASSTTQSISTGTSASTQMRVLCLTGSLAYANVDGIDSTSVLTPAAVAATQKLQLLPDNTGTSMTTAIANANLINAATVDGSTVAIAGGLGDVYVAAIQIGSDCNFTVNSGTRLKRVAGYSYNILRNRRAQNGCYVNGLIITGGSFTVPEPGHTRQVGDVVWVEGFLTNTTMNGAKTIAAVVPGVLWSFAATGSNPTNTGQQLAFVSPYVPLSGANVTRTSNVVTVLEAGHNRGIGNHVYVTGLSGTNTFNGAQEIVSVTPGVSWTYANTGANETAIGTGCLLGDYGITAVLELDGNSDNVSATQWGANVSAWINCSSTSIFVRKARYGQYGRMVGCWNVSDFRVPQFHADRKVGVAVQFDSSCTRCEVTKPTGIDYADDVVAWGVTSNVGAFGDTASPTGPGNMGSLVVDALTGNSGTGILKMYATAGYDLGRVKVGKINGIGQITIGDSTAGVSGGTITSLTIDDVDNIPLPNGGQISLGGGGAFSNMGHITIGRIVDNGATSLAVNSGFSTNGYVISQNGDPIDTLTIGQYISRVARSYASFGIGSLFKGPINTLRVSNVDTVGDANCNLFYLQTGVIDTVHFDKWTHKGTSQTCNLWAESGSGYATNIFFRGLRVNTAAKIYACTSAGATHNIYFEDFVGETVAGPIGSDSTGTFNIMLTNVDVRSTGNNLIQFYLSGQTVNVKGKNVKAPAGKYCLFTGSTVISLDGSDFRVDLGANGAAPPSQLTPNAGDMLYNTNATGAGLYGRTAAAAWAKIF